MEEACAKSDQEKPAETRRVWTETDNQNCLNRILFRKNPCSKPSIWF